MAKGIVVSVHITVAGMENYSGTFYKFECKKTLSQFTQKEVDSVMDAVNETIKRETRGLTQMQAELVLCRNAQIEAKQELEKLEHKGAEEEAEVI